MIIEDSHNIVCQKGVKETFTQVRSQYWITAGGQAVKKIIGACITCKRLEGISYRSPPTVPLPDFRVHQERPLKYTGIDCCGPAYMRTASHTEKNYIVLMTCAAARMIHLELVRDLSVTLYVRCLKRFVGRRELPKSILSDNGKTFKTDQLKVSNSKNGIIWRFNLAKAPWWGRLFERLTRSTKRCLRLCVRNCTLTYEEFYTSLVEIEGVLNSRPLTYLDKNDIEEPLTPIHLYRGHRILNPIKGEGYESDPDFKNNCEQALSRKHQLEQVLQSFWKSWRKEHLLEHLLEIDTCQKQNRRKRHQSE